jgi:hypothetical protein
MRDAQKSLLYDTGPPKTTAPRAQIDTVVNRVLPEPWEVLTSVAQGFVRLPQGDARQVLDLAALVEAAEAAAVEASTSAFVDPTPHHSV